MLETRNLFKTYRSGTVETEVLKGVDFAVRDGEFVAIMGRTGAGKSTLLYQMSLLDEPTSGAVLLHGRAVHALGEKEKASLRLNTFGYVFQDYALIPELSALENVAVPLLMHGEGRERAYQRAREALAKVGLDEVDFGNLPSQLSGGEQQRVSISRAIAHSPAILFADEPTANLDRISSAAVMKIFGELNRAGQTIIMVTHEDEYAAFTQRVVYLDDGKIVPREATVSAEP